MRDRTVIVVVKDERTVDTSTLCRIVDRMTSGQYDGGQQTLRCRNVRL